MIMLVNPTPIPAKPSMIGRADRTFEYTCITGFIKQLGLSLHNLSYLNKNIEYAPLKVNDTRGKHHTIVGAHVVNNIFKYSHYRKIWLHMTITISCKLYLTSLLEYKVSMPNIASSIASCLSRYLMSVIVFLESILEWFNPVLHTGTFNGTVSSVLSMVL